MLTEYFPGHAAILRDLERVILANASFDASRQDLNRMFREVDRLWTHQRPEQRSSSQWISPVHYGGHVPRHLPAPFIRICFALYLLHSGSPLNRTSFLTGPLRRETLDILTFPPGSPYRLWDPQEQPQPLTHLHLYPRIPQDRERTVDLYGLPPMPPQVDVIVWHAFARSSLEATLGGAVLVDLDQGQVISPLALRPEDCTNPGLDPGHFLQRISRSQERLVDLLDLSLQALQDGHETVRKTVQAYLDRGLLGKLPR
nr:hypothetical protein [uncultured Holophaga sp.]